MSFGVADNAVTTARISDAVWSGPRKRYPGLIFACQLSSSAYSLIAALESTSPSSACPLLIAVGLVETNHVRTQLKLSIVHPLIIAADRIGYYSTLLSAFGLGAIAGALTTAHRGKVEGRGRLLLLAFATHGVLATLALASRTPPLTIALLFGSGFCVVTAFSMLNSLVQEHAPNELRGRVLSLFGLAFRGGGPLGALLAGVLVKIGGAPLVLSGYSLALALVALTFLARSRRLREL